MLTHPFDPTADYVVEELNRRGVPVFRWDPGEFPKRLTLAATLAGMGWVGRLHLPEREVALDDIGCAYYRRPTIFDLPEDMADNVRRWAAHEARMGLGGVLSVTTTAHLFQEWIDKAYEVRLTQVDDAVFATRIDAHSESASIDWRSDYDHLSYSPLQDVPCDVRAGVSSLLRRMRLRFGVLDFIVTPDDRWVFLEINPNGQWAWIEDATAQPITSAIADALQRQVP